MTIESIIAEMPSSHANAAYVDSNVILRYLTREPPEMAEAAQKVFSSAERGEVRLLVSTVTLAEVVWVLSSVYDLTRSAITAQLLALVTAQGLETDDQDQMTLALSLYRDKNIDFTDALLAAHSLFAGPPVVYSFDRHFDRIPGIRRRIPGRSSPQEE
jgi:predicted nucleic acid-binding protein